MSARTPLVTIAIPTFNRAQTYLPQALASALGQTYHDIEIIVSDNCSSDQTPAVVARCHDPRVRYFRRSVSVSPNDNFNFCLEQARGEYFLLLLDDELVDRDFVEICVNGVSDRSNVGLVRTGLRVIDANGNVVNEVPNRAAGLSLANFLLAWFDGQTALYLCNTLFNTALLRSIGGLRSRHNLFQDVMAQVRVAAISGRVDIDNVLASTRSHPGQFTYSAKVYGWVEDAGDLLDLMTLLVSDEREIVRKRGMRFFATICYSRAGAIPSLWERLRTYHRIYQMFQRCCVPPIRLVIASTTLYKRLRTIKRWVKRQPSWAAAS